MRWMVFFVIVLNVLLFVWFTFQKDIGVQNTVAQAEVASYPDAKNLVLLSEVSESELLTRDVRRVSALGNAQDEPGAASDVISQCSLVGPFLEVISVKQAKNRLEGSGFPSKTVSVLKVLPVINWVYIPPMPDRKKALAVLKSLQADNIDSFLIADGEYANGISLGFFSNIESAKVVLNERLKQGYPVSLMEKKREQKTYWLAFDSDVSVRLSETQLKSLEEGSFVVKKQEKDCDEVALLPVIE